MINSMCVRCSLKFNQNDHPMADFSSICDSCKQDSPETIDDQAININNRFIKINKEIKNKCDHILGMHHHYDSLIFSIDNYDLEIDSITKFIYCPKCGEKLSDDK